MMHWLGNRGLLVVAVIVVLADLFAVTSYFGTFSRIGWENLGRPHRFVRDADLDPMAFYTPTGPLVAALRVIPPDASYTIVVGDDPPGANPEIVRDAYKLWLVPRTYTDQLSDAQWVIAYDHSSETLGIRYTNEIGLGPDVNAVEVAR